MSDRDTRSLYIRDVVWEHYRRVANGQKKSISWVIDNILGQQIGLPLNMEEIDGN